MTRAIVIFDGYGQLLGVGIIGNKEQTEICIQDIVENHGKIMDFEVTLDDDEWEFIENNQATNISIEVESVDSDIVEVYTRVLIDPTHYQVGE